MTYPTESSIRRFYDFAPNISTENYKNVANYRPYHGTYFGDRYGCPFRCENSLDIPVTPRNYCKVTKHQSGCTYEESRENQRNFINLSVKHHELNESRVPPTQTIATVGAYLKMNNQEADTWGRTEKDKITKSVANSLKYCRKRQKLLTKLIKEEAEIIKEELE